jgi:hypothetical protein
LAECLMAHGFSQGFWGQARVMDQSRKTPTGGFDFGNLNWGHPHF